jgi:hypothetical protein
VSRPLTVDDVPMIVEAIASPRETELLSLVRGVIRDEFERATSDGPACISPLPGGCDFCRLNRKSVRVLIVGRHNAGICNECVAAAVQEILGHCPQEVLSLPAVIPRDLSDGRFVRSRDVDRHGGLVYAVALMPDVDVRRIKVGYTTRPIELRIEAFKTTNPTASLLGLWNAPADGEAIAHGLVRGRIGNSEVFSVPDVVAAVTTIDEEMRRRWP